MNYNRQKKGIGFSIFARGLMKMELLSVGVGATEVES